MSAGQRLCLGDYARLEVGETRVTDWSTQRGGGGAERGRGDSHK